MQAHRERVGRQIRRARVTAGLSHDRLAIAVGSSRQHLIRLEKGEHLARPGMLEKIAEATGKAVEFFESDDEEESDPMVDLLAAIKRMVRDEVRVATA